MEVCDEDAINTKRTVGICKRIRYTTRRCYSRTKIRHKSKDDKALSTIALSIEPDQQVHIVYCETARQAWLVLEEIYEPKSRQRIMQLKRQFVRTRLKDDENMESYLSRLKICADF